MDPFVATMLKQAGAIALGFLGVGLPAAAVYVVSKYARYQHALTLNVVPPGLS